VEKEASHHKGNLRETSRLVLNTSMNLLSNLCTLSPNLFSYLLLFTHFPTVKAVQV